MKEAARSAALSEDRLIRRLVKLVTELDLDCRDFAIFGSGPLLAHGLRRRIRDLDVVARGAVWRRVTQQGFPAAGAINGAPMALFWGGLIQFSAGWISEDWDTDDLIDRAETIQGLPFAQLTDVLAYKLMLRRPKDRPDIEALLDLSRQSDRTHRLISSRAAWRPANSNICLAERLNSWGTGLDTFYCWPGIEGAHEKGGVEGEVGRFRRNGRRDTGGRVRGP